MANIVKLNYTADEINTRLGQVTEIDEKVGDIDSVLDEINGGGTISSGGSSSSTIPVITFEVDFTGTTYVELDINDELNQILNQILNQDVIIKLYNIENDEYIYC